MACTENGLGGHSCSSIMVPVDKNGSRETYHNVPLRYLNSMLKDGDDAELCGRPRAPLRSPFTVPRPAARILETPRPLRHPFTLAPAVKGEFLATAEVNSSEGLERQSKKGHDSINMSQESSGTPMTPMTRGPRVGNGVTGRSGNSSKPYTPVPRFQGCFPPRGPQSQGTSRVSTVRSGITKEETPGNGGMANNSSLPHGPFPLGNPRQPMDNCQQNPPFNLLNNVPGLFCSAANCFMPPQFPAFNPFLVMPFPFIFPLGFCPPLFPFFFQFNTPERHPPPHLN